MSPETHRFADDGAIPNSPLPVLVYHGVEEPEARFGGNSLLGPRSSATARVHYG